MSETSIPPRASRRASSLTARTSASSGGTLTATGSCAAPTESVYKPGRVSGRLR